MQVNNTSTNFGSIKLSAGADTSAVKLTRDTLNNLFKFNVAKANQSVDEARATLRPSEQAMFMFRKKERFIVGANIEDEHFMFKKIKEFFDPKAEFIDDCPPTKFDEKDPFMDLFV